MMLNRPVGEIKVIIHSDNIVEGYGICPLCDHTVGGKLNLRQMVARGFHFSDDQKARMFARFISSRHKDRCEAKEVLPYDHRFDGMVKDPTTKRMKYPLDHPLVTEPKLAQEIMFGTVRSATA